MARKIPKISSKMSWIDKLLVGIGGASPIVGRDALYRSNIGNTKKARLAAQLAKYGKWGLKAGTYSGLLNPWTAVPVGLMSLAKYGVGKAFDPYRDETGRIGAAGHERLASAARAREELMTARNAARKWDPMRTMNKGGLASILRYYG